MYPCNASNIRLSSEWISNSTGLERSTAADSYNRFGIYKPITSAKIKFPVKPIDNIDKCTDRINIPKLNVHFFAS